MKAIVATQYGSPDVLQLKEVQKPTPKGKYYVSTFMSISDWASTPGYLIPLREE